MCKRLKYIVLLFPLILLMLTATSFAERVLKPGEIKLELEQMESEQVEPKMEVKNIHLGKKFIKLCESPNERARRSCGEVVTSFINAHVEMMRHDPSQRVICPARTLTAEEGRRAFLRWVKFAPEAPTIEFPELVMQALRFLYRCDMDLYD